MQQWEYREIFLVVDPKESRGRWGDHSNWKMFPAARLNKEAGEGWELVTAFSIVQLGRQEVHFLLKRGPLM